MASLIDSITQEQFNWLKNNIKEWYGIPNTVICKIDSWSYIAVLKGISGITSQVQYFAISAAGEPVSPAIRTITDPTGQWYQIYNGIYEGEVLFYKNFGENQIDSYNTLGIPEVVFSVEDRDVELRKTGLLIFHSLAYFLQYITDSASLDQIYIGSRSGDKYCSKFLLGFLDKDNKISQDNEERLARAIVAQYGDTWEKLHNTLLLEYEPLETFHKTEIHSNSDSEIQTPTNWKKTSSSDSVDNVETEDSKIFGFNSDAGVNDRKNEKTFKHKNEEKQEGTFTTTHNYGHQIETYGNMGSQTAQELIEQQRKVLDWNFWERIFNDLDYLLTKNFLGGLK